jgi:hypothetical protein
MASPVKSKPVGWPGGVPGPKWSTVKSAKQDVKAPAKVAAKAPSVNPPIGFSMKKKDSGGSQMDWAKQQQIKVQGHLAATGRGKPK